MTPAFKPYAKDTSAIVSHVFTAIGLTVTGVAVGTVMYITLVRDIQAADDKIEDIDTASHENELRIDGVDVRLQAVERKQDVLLERVDQESSKQEEYRERSEKTLDRILRKLD